MVEPKRGKREWRTTAVCCRIRKGARRQVFEVDSPATSFLREEHTEHSSGVCVCVCVYCATEEGGGGVDLQVTPRSTRTLEIIAQTMETQGPCLRGLFDKDDDNVHPLVNNSIFKACPAGMRFDTKEVQQCARFMHIHVLRYASYVRNSKQY